MAVLRRKTTFESRNPKYISRYRKTKCAVSYGSHNERRARASALTRAREASHSSRVARVVQVPKIVNHLLVKPNGWTPDGLDIGGSHEQLQVSDQIFLSVELSWLLFSFFVELVCWTALIAIQLRAEPGTILREAHFPFHFGWSHQRVSREVPRTHSPVHNSPHASPSRGSSRAPRESSRQSRSWFTMVKRLTFVFVGLTVVLAILTIALLYYASRLDTARPLQSNASPTPSPTATATP